MSGLAWSEMGWDDFLDFRGNQEETSLRLVESLAALLIVPIGKPFLSRGENTLWMCEKCRRAAGPGMDRCSFCDGGLIGKRF